MTVTAEPVNGKEVPTITQQDVMVYQGHEQRPVTNWLPATGHHANLELAVLIDDSSGFSLGTELGDIRHFINEQSPTTLVAVAYMQNGTVSLAHDFTTDHAAAAKCVRLPMGYFGAEASPYLSISSFIRGWHSSTGAPARREIFAITSGIDRIHRFLSKPVCGSDHPRRSVRRRSGVFDLHAGRGAFWA